MNEAVATSDAIQQNAIGRLFQEANIVPGSWCASRLPEPEAQDVVLYSTLQPHFLNSTRKSLEQGEKVRAPSSGVSPRGA